jgi:hypothetical protein
VTHHFSSTHPRASLKKCLLTHRTNGPIIGLSGCAIARPTTAERILKMKHPNWGALGRPTSNEIHPTECERSGEAEAGTQFKQRSDGRSVRGSGRPAMAEVHRRGSSAGNQPAPSVFCDGPTRAGRADDQARAGSHAFGRSDDRARQAVTLARVEQPSFPASITRLVNEALRAAAIAPTVFDALDVAGAALRAVADLARMEVNHG